MCLEACSFFSLYVILYYIIKYYAIMFANKTHGEKARWELHKIVTCCFGQILEVKPHETAYAQPLTSHLTSHPGKTNKTLIRCCQRNEDKLITDVLLWTFTHGRTSIGWPVRIYLHQLCADTGCSLEHLPGVMEDEADEAIW